MWRALKRIWKRITKEPEVDKPEYRVNPTGTGRGGQPTLYRVYPKHPKQHKE